MTRRQFTISPDQLSLIVTDGQLLMPEPMNPVVQDAVIGMLPSPRDATENVTTEKIWPDAVDLATYRRSMLDALTPIGAANRSRGFVRAAANPDACADIYQRYGPQVPSMVEEKGHRADRTIEASRRWFYIAQGLGNLATAQSCELTPAQITVRSEIQQLWEAFADRYVKPGRAASKKRNAYIKSLKTEPAVLSSSLQYAPPECMLRLV